MDPVVSGLSGAPVTESRSTACFSAGLFSERNRHFSGRTVSQASACLYCAIPGRVFSIPCCFVPSVDRRKRHNSSPTAMPNLLACGTCLLAGSISNDTTHQFGGRPPFERSWVRSFESRSCRICGFASRLPFAPNRHPKCNMSNSRDSVTYAR
jgi:hypothetical protein